MKRSMAYWLKGCFLSFLLSLFNVYAADLHTQFRQEVGAYVRAVGQAIVQKKPYPDHALDLHWDQAYQKPHWILLAKRYCQGRLQGLAKVKGGTLSHILQDAVDKTLKVSSSVMPCQWRLTFYYTPYGQYTFLDSGQRIIGKHIAIQKVDTTVLKEQILSSYAYLMRVMHPSYYGFYKLYHVPAYKKQVQLRTVYTASSLYTLLKAEAIIPLQSVLDKNIAQFLLNAQIKQGPHRGAFYYAYHPKKNKYIPVLVVGSTSKTIFTLLLLHQKYPQDPRYLKVAQLAGDWLIAQIKPDGTLRTKWVYRQHHWVSHHQQSFLYSGQVLSALSRLYHATGDQRYLHAALPIMNRFYQALQQHLLLADDYRPANSISSSWVLMSWIDYAQATHTSQFDSSIEKLAKFLIKRQNQTPHDIYDYGRYWDALTPSGNGWINEVMGHVYHFCQQHQWKACYLYRDAMIRTSRWLIQNAYTKKNTYNLKYPLHVIGGYMTSDNIPTIRTDAVCHSINSMVDLYHMIKTMKQPLLVLEEQLFEEMLPKLRKG